MSKRQRSDGGITENADSIVDEGKGERRREESVASEKSGLKRPKIGRENKQDRLLEGRKQKTRTRPKGKGAAG